MSTSLRGLSFVFAVVFAVLGLSAQSMACTPQEAAKLTRPDDTFLQVQCGQGADVGYVAMTLYYQNGQLNMSYSCFADVTACYLGYETDLNGANWAVQTYGPGTSFVTTVGEGWYYYALGDQYDGTQFGVRAGPCQGGYCNPAVVYP